MANCPDCGNIIMEGDPYCSHCGAHLIWNNDDEKEEYIQESGFVSESGDDYEDMILNGLMESEYGRRIVPELSYSIGEVKKESGLKLFKIQPHESNLILQFKGEYKYYDVYMNAIFDLTQLPLHKLSFDPYDIKGDFTKLYENDDFKKLIDETEQKNNSTFLNCTLQKIANRYLINVIFNDGKYILNPDKMEFAQ